MPEQAPPSRSACVRLALAGGLLGALLVGGCRGPRAVTEADAARAAEARVAVIRARAADRGDFDASVGVRSFARGPVLGRLEDGDAVAEGLPYDAYAADLSAGAALTADLRAADFGVVVAVLAPSGVTAYGGYPEDDAHHAHLAMTAPEAGVYLVLVMPAEGSTGGVYELDVRAPGPVVAYPPELLR